MLIKDKNSVWIDTNLDDKTMAELYTRIDIIEKKIDDISIYNKKVESAKRMDRYVDEGLTRGRTTNLTTLQTVSAILLLDGKITDKLEIMLTKFLSRMAQEWKGGVLLINDIHREFYDYLDKIDKNENFHTFFNENHKSISEMIKAVRQKHKKIESTNMNVN